MNLELLALSKNQVSQELYKEFFYYPTKYLVKKDDGEFQYYNNTHEISFDGYERPKTSLSIPDVPYDGIGSSYAGVGTISG